MKTKVFLFLAALFFLIQLPFFSEAQFVKGSKLVEGSVGDITVTSNKTTNKQSGYPDSKSKNTGFSIGINPRIGFFLTNNLAVGTTLGLSFANSKSTGFDDVTGKKRLPG